MKESELITRIDYLLDKGKKALSTKKPEAYGSNYYVDEGPYNGFKASSLSFIEYLFGADSTYYKMFSKAVKDVYDYCIESGMSILEEVKSEVQNGWLYSYKEIVTAEVFSDFMEMSDHILSEGYKDAAAVMIGSVLEEHLRQLCKKHKVETTFIKADEDVPKKADVLNADLKKADVYGPIEQKLVTAWLGLRNSAAHGKYKDYTKEQVELMYQGVLGFISQTK